MQMNQRPAVEKLRAFNMVVVKAFSLKCTSGSAILMLIESESNLLSGTVSNEPILAYKLSVWIDFDPDPDLRAIIRLAAYGWNNLNIEPNLIQ